MYKFLVVDDERLSRETVKVLIDKKKLPIKVYEAKNGREAIEQYKKINPDFVFLDIKMPGIDGLEAGKIIKNYDNDALITYLTAWNSFDYAKEAIQIGVKEYLVKPVEFEDIYFALSKLMEIVDSRIAKKKALDNKLRAVLNQFSRSFFESLKFDKIDKSTLVSYFGLEGERCFNALALVVGNLDSENLSKFIKHPIFNKSRIYYFESVDRYTFIIFSKNIESLISILKKTYFSFGLSIGIGPIFSSLDVVGNSIRFASISYSIAIAENKNCHEYSLGDEQYFKSHDICKVLRDIECSIGNLDLKDARKRAHELTDSLKIKEDLELYYESILILKHYFDNSIDYLKLPTLIKNDFGQLEIYLMDMLDLSYNALKIDKKDKWKRAFDMILDVINTNYSKNLSVEYMASLLDINEKYFSKLFKLYFSQKYIDYLTKVRMENASRFLLEGLSVNEVASLTGYKDPAYFSKVFQQYYKTNPSCYTN